MGCSAALKTASALLVVIAIFGGLAALLLAAFSALFVYTHLTADRFSVGPLVWVLNPALWLTPLLFVAGAVFAIRAAQRMQLRHLLYSVALCCVSIVIMWSYVRFDPLVEVDGCFDAGGVWQNGQCSR